MEGKGKGRGGGWMEEGGREGGGKRERRDYELTVVNGCVGLTQFDLSVHAQ